MSTLRSRVIRLAHENPDLRPHLLPLLKTADEEFTLDEEAQILWDRAFDARYDRRLAEWVKDQTAVLDELKRLLRFWAYERKGNLRESPTEEIPDVTSMKRVVFFRHRKLMVDFLALKAKLDFDGGIVVDLQDIIDGFDRALTDR